MGLLIQATRDDIAVRRISVAGGIFTGNEGDMGAEIIRFRADSPELHEYFLSVLKEQGWTVSDLGDGMLISTGLPGGGAYSLMLPGGTRNAMQAIEDAYRESVRNGLKKGFEDDGKSLDSVIGEASGAVMALRKLRNAFSPHEPGIPEWLKDIASCAASLGMETVCTKPDERYSLLCVVPYLDFAVEFKGSGAEEMSAAINYGAGAYSEKKQYMHVMEGRPCADGYKVIAKAELAKQQLKRLSEYVRRLVPPGA